MDLACNNHLNKSVETDGDKELNFLNNKIIETN